MVVFWRINGPCQFCSVVTNASVGGFLRLSAAVLLIALPGSMLHAQPGATDDDIFSLESPVVQRIMKQAALIERRSHQAKDQEYAVKMYCVASRLGSLEAQFRLGKMLLEGRGVLMSIEKAATLFSIASGNGHEGAKSMLAVTGARKINLPDCLKNQETRSDTEHVITG